MGLEISGEAYPKFHAPENKAWKRDIVALDGLCYGLETTATLTLYNAMQRWTNDQAAFCPTAIGNPMMYKGI